MSDTKWVSKEELIAFFNDSSKPTPPWLGPRAMARSVPLIRRRFTPFPSANDFTPWFKLIAESFLYKWWDALLASRTGDDKLDARKLIPQVQAEDKEMGGIIRM